MRDPQSAGRNLSDFNGMLSGYAIPILSKENEPSLKCLEIKKALIFSSQLREKLFLLRKIIIGAAFKFYHDHNYVGALNLIFVLALWFLKIQTVLYHQSLPNMQNQQ